MPSHRRSPVYSVGEEVANSVTHGIGVCLSIAGLVILIVYAVRFGDAWRVVSFSVYGSTLLLMFLGSTLYHSFTNPTVKRVLRIVDHDMIYLLIAGTYTPFMLVSLRGPWGWSMFGVIWGLAVSGIVLKSVMIGRHRILSTAIYLSMGWLCLISLKPMMAAVPAPGMWGLFAGGVLYTCGAVFYGWHALPYNHAVWHLFVLAGSACHFFAILYYVR